MNYRSRLIGVAALTAATALVILFPRILSTPVVLPTLVAHLSRHLPGTLTTAGCTLQWTGGLSCDNLSYTDQGMGTHLQLMRVSTDKGLFTLLAAPQYLGEITVEQPTLRFFPPQEHAAPAPPDALQPVVGEGQQLPVSWWEERSLRLKLLNGKMVDSQGDAQNPRVLASKINLSGDLAAGTLKYLLDAQSGQSTGQLHAQGYVNLPIAGQPFWASLVSQSILDIRSMELEPILALAASRFSGIPAGKGTVNGACRLNMTGIDNLEINGLASVDDLELAGGFLGQDQPQLNLARLKFALRRRPAEGWRLSEMELQSAPLSVVAQGAVDAEKVDFSAQGKADLPLLAAALPHLFAIHQQTRIHQGTLAFAVDAKGNMEQVQLRADCHTERLQFTQADQSYSWENPLSLQLQTVLGPNAVHVDALQFQAPFLSVEGQGGLENFTFKATADLDHLFSELEKIFAVPLHAQGRLHVDLHSTRTEQDLVRLTTRLNVEDLGLHLGDQVLLPAHPFSLNAELTAHPWFSPQSGVENLQLTAVGWPGKVQLQASHPTTTPLTKNEQVQENLQITSHLDLARLQQLVAAIQRGNDPWQLQGQLQAEIGGMWQETRLYLHRLSGSLEHGALLHHGQILLQEPNIELSFEQSPLKLGALNLGELQIVSKKKILERSTPEFCRIDLTAPTLVLPHVRLRAPDMIVDLQASLGGGGDARHEPLFSWKGLGDLRLLVPWWRQAGWLAKEAETAGLARFDGALYPEAAQQPAKTTVSLRVKDLVINAGQGPLFTDPELQLALELRPGSNQSAGRLTQLSLQSSALSFRGAGMVHKRDSQSFLDLQGELHLGAATLTSLLENRIPGDIFLKAVEPGSILLSAPLHFPVDITQLTLNGQVPLQNLRYLGVQLPSAEASVDLNRGELTLHIQGRDKEAQVNLQAAWKDEGGKLFLTLPPDCHPLSNLPISPMLAEGLMRALPPLGTLVEVRGTVGLRVSRFTLPLDDKRRLPDFALVLDLEKARPEASPALRRLLEIAGLTGPLRFQERELVCEGWNGSMTCAPLRLKAGRDELRISGSKRRSGSIAYRVEIPVTEKLAQRAGISVLGRFSAQAEIGGTTRDPVFAENRFLQGLAGQIAASLPKPLVESASRAGQVSASETSPKVD